MKNRRGGGVGGDEEEGTAPTKLPPRGIPRYTHLRTVAQRGPVVRVAGARGSEGKVPGRDPKPDLGRGLGARHPDAPHLPGSSGEGQVHLRGLPGALSEGNYGRDPQGRVVWVGAGLRVVSDLEPWCPQVVQAQLGNKQRRPVHQQRPLPTAHAYTPSPPSASIPHWTTQLQG